MVHESKYNNADVDLNIYFRSLKFDTRARPGWGSLWGPPGVNAASSLQAPSLLWDQEVIRGSTAVTQTRAGMGVNKDIIIATKKFLVIGENWICIFLHICVANHPSLCVTSCEEENLYNDKHCIYSSDSSAYEMWK